MSLHIIPAIEVQVDPLSLDAFCRAEWPRLVRALTLYLKDQPAAEDLAQEALARAAVRWTNVSRLDSPSAWVRRVALNLATSEWRRRTARRRALERFGPAPSAALDADRSLDLVEAVGRLPKDQRAALAFRYYLDLPVDEVAKRMGRSPDAVRSLTKRAVQQLRSDLVDPEEGDRHAL